MIRPTIFMSMRSLGTMRTKCARTYHILKLIEPKPAPVKNPREYIDAKSMDALDETGERRLLFSRNNPEAAKSGDVLQVETPGSTFNGVLLAVRRAGVNTSFVLRNQVRRLGVEMRYNLFNPNLKRITLITRGARRTRRAKLYYIRQPNHDVGNVDNLVRQEIKRKKISSK